MSDDKRKIARVITPEMRERLDRLANPDEATRALIEQIEAELKEGQEKGKAT